MIIKTAPPHTYVGKLVAHLQRTDDGNEQIRFLGGRGVVAGDDLRDALTEMKALSRGSCCEKPLYHVAFNAAPGEDLSAAQWERCLELWERAMGLQDHQRAVVQHFKEGRWHTHAVWNRVDPETGLAVSIGRDHFTAKAVARKIERELGLRQVSDKRPKHRADQLPPERWESEQSRRTKTDTHEARDGIRRAWQSSDDGRSFQHALLSEGLVLAQGEKRPFVVVDCEGNFYALSGRVLPGERMANIKLRLADVGRDQLPTLEQARDSLQISKKLQSIAGQSGSEAPSPSSRSSAAVADPVHAKFRDLHREAKREFEAKQQEVTREQEKQRSALAESHARDRARVMGRKISLRERLLRREKRIDRERLATLAQIEQEKKQQLRVHEQRQTEIRADYDDRAKALREQEKAERLAAKQAPTKQFNIDSATAIPVPPLQRPVAEQKSEPANHTRRDKGRDFDR